jgi:hypothetical protein
MSVVRHAVFTSNQGLLRSQNTQIRYPLCRFSVPLLLSPQYRVSQLAARVIYGLRQIIDQGDGPAR